MRSLVAPLSGFVATVASYKYINNKFKNREVERIQAKVENQPEYKWDFNWDKRHPQDDWTDDMKEKFTSKKTRFVYLIRHGQYMDGEKDADRFLSEKGREQARLCGLYLKQRGVKPTQFVHSTMTRATETAKLINSELQVECPVEKSDLIREGCPVIPEPPLKNYPHKPWIEHKESLPIEAGFRKYIRRAKPTSTENEHAVIVCHGNVIRYFMCRGLQLPPTAWLHMTVAHCSITSLHCRASGTVGTRGIGESAYLPPNLITYQNEKPPNPEPKEKEE